MTITETETETAVTTGYRRKVTVTVADHGTYLRIDDTLEGGVVSARLEPEEATTIAHALLGINDHHDLDGYAARVFAKHRRDCHDGNIDDDCAACLLAVGAASAVPLYNPADLRARWANENQPYDEGGLLTGPRYVEQFAPRDEAAERERDEWRARAEAAERERDALREEQWPRDDIKPGDDVIYLGNRYGSSPCPRGAVFAVRAVHEESGRVSFDWPGVDGACVDLSRVRKVENRAEDAAREASTWRTSTESAHSDFLQADYERDEWKARAEKAEARAAVDTVYAVTEEDVDYEEVTMHVTVTALETTREYRTSRRTVGPGETPERLRQSIRYHLRSVAELEAIARAMEEG